MLWTEEDFIRPAPKWRMVNEPRTGRWTEILLCILLGLVAGFLIGICV